MSATMAPELAPKGFSFDNCKRNAFLESKGYVTPKMTKTGTTIVGVTFKDGVILGSDTRATSALVSSKDCQKLHHMAKSIYCAGAGTAADCDMVTRMIESQLALHSLNTGREPRVATAVRILKQYLYRYQGHVGCALIVGGVDSTGFHLNSIAPHGSTMNLPFVTMGSGSLAAGAVLELQWEPNMELERAKKLVRDAIVAGILNDMGSGSNVDLVVITHTDTKLLRPYENACKKGERAATYGYPKGTTTILETKVVPFDIEGNVVQVIAEAEPMDI